MANNSNEGGDHNLDSSKDSGLDKSFVGKFVSGLLNNTPLSKWFGKDSSSKSVIRRRDDDDDDEEDSSYIFQPPVKRAKLPSSDIEHNNYSAQLFESPVTVHNASNNINNVSSKVYGNFTESVAGPSGIKSRKLFEKHSTTSSTNTVSNSFENQDIVNGDNDSDSEESTSGYSSAPRLVKGKAPQNSNNTQTCEKTTPKPRSLFISSNDPNHSRTLFTERSSQMNTSLSSRRPNFNASTFGSPNFVDKTLSTRRIMSSPFYSGNTIYGGASAYGRRLGKSAEELNQAPRISIQIKPVNEKPTNENTTLSKTARRILSTLEQYSTPISDAKKIPITPKRQGVLSKYVGATPYMIRDRKRPSNKELQVPTIPELLQMKQKERLQNSTESVRQIASSSKSTLNKEEYKLRTDDDSKHKHSNKMKNNISSLRQKPVELVSEVKLPKVSLPITTLPKFDFVMMPPQKINETNKSPSLDKSQDTHIPKSKSSLEVEKSDKKTMDNRDRNNFIFSEPVVISKDLKPVVAINCFKFSEPLCKKQTTSEERKTPDKSVNFGSFKMKNNGENVKTSEYLMKNNLTDNSELDKSISTIEWECPTCLVKNNLDKNICVACQEPKSQTPQEQKNTVGFGEQFKLSSDKWECSTCLVRNNNSDTNCVACSTAKPSDNKSSLPKSTPKSGFGDKFKPPPATWECGSCLIRNKNELDKCAACNTPKSKQQSVVSNFGDKFKPPSDTWECTSCMIRNKNDLDKCAACQTLRIDSKSVPIPKSDFGDKFKPSNDTWECPTCMIRCKNDVIKCVACETPKPGQKTTPITTFTFGIKPTEWDCKSCMVKNKENLDKCASCEKSRKEEKETVSKGFGDVFKMKNDEWECSSCLVRNKSDISACVCCGVAKPGSTNEKLTEVDKENEKKPVISFNFGIDKSGPAQFKFGVPPAKNEKEVSSTPTVPIIFGDVAKSNPVTTSSTSSSFTFGINAQEKNAPVKSITSTSETVTSTVSSNPLLKPNEKLPEKATPAPIGFKFGLENSNLSQKVGNENLVTSTSRTEAVPVAFPGGFESSKLTFEFKPAAVNGDINKPKDSLFTKPAESGNLFSNTSSTPTFKFELKPKENTSSTTITTTSKPDTNPTNLFKFGADTSQSPNPAKRSLVETNENNVSNGFGSLTKIPSFGSTQGFGSTETKPFSFGNNETTTPKNTTFSFGQSADKPANPVFNFGSGASSTPNPGFNFSVQNTGFNFGNTKVENQPFRPVTNVFDSGGSAAKNGSFNFGTNSNNNNQKAIFTFGASQTNQPTFTPPNQPAGFNFGSSAPPAAPSGGFSFTGAVPTFNFTDGSATAPPQRKIKKALRRTQR